MKRTSIRVLTALLLTLLALPATAHTAPPGPDFRDLLARLDAAWSSLKAENAAAFYAPNADIVFFDVAPLKYQGWNAYRDGAQKAFLDGARSLKFTPNDDLKVTRRHGLAWTTRTVHVGAVMKDGKPIDVECRHTAIWEYRAGKWLIVHEHLSAPLPG